MQITDTRMYNIDFGSDGGFISYSTARPDVTISTGHCPGFSSSFVHVKPSEVPDLINALTLLLEAIHE